MARELIEISGGHFGMPFPPGKFRAPNDPLTDTRVIIRANYDKRHGDDTAT